ncbi:MAG: hypothetical protein QM734_16265 [Cyclobacteriaceae bacterium]
MKKRLVITSIINFPIWLLINKYLFDKSWVSSLFGAVFWVMMFDIGMLFFIKWWAKKVEEQRKK